MGVKDGSRGTMEMVTAVCKVVECRKVVEFRLYFKGGAARIHDIGYGL